MAIYSLQCEIGSRSKGQSATAHAAYILRSKIYCEEDQETKNYSNLPGLLYSGVMLCDNAPDEYNDPEVLCNAIMKKENAVNSQLYRTFKIALPKELPLEENIKLLEKMVKSFADEGMCVIYSIHDQDYTLNEDGEKVGNGNIHAHIIVTTRAIGSNGKWLPKTKETYKRDAAGNKIPSLDKNGKQRKRKSGQLCWERDTVKTTDWDEQFKVQEWRERWQNIHNNYIDNYVDCLEFEREDAEKIKDALHIDCRSNEARGIALLPQIHEGYKAKLMEKEGKISERCEYNRAIKVYNESLKLDAEIKPLEDAAKEAEQEKAMILNEIAALQIEAEQAEQAEDLWNNVIVAAADEQPRYTIEDYAEAVDAVKKLDAELSKAEIKAAVSDKEINEILKDTDAYKNVLISKRECDNYYCNYRDIKAEFESLESWYIVASEDPPVFNPLKYIDYRKKESRYKNLKSIKDKYNNLENAYNANKNKYDNLVKTKSKELYQLRKNKITDEINAKKAVYNLKIAEIKEKYPDIITQYNQYIENKKEKEKENELNKNTTKKYNKEDKIKYQTSYSNKDKK